MSHVTNIVLPLWIMLIISQPQTSAKQITDNREMKHSIDKTDIHNYKNWRKTQNTAVNTKSYIGDQPRIKEKSKFPNQKIQETKAIPYNSVQKTRTNVEFRYRRGHPKRLPLPIHIPRSPLPSTDKTSHLPHPMHLPRLPLPSTDKTFALVDNIECPTDRCYCQKNSKGQLFINCYKHKLKTIPTFSEIDTVFYELDLHSGNLIRNISFRAFKNLKVERINLLGNDLATIESGAFVGLEPYLKELEIQGNGSLVTPYDKISNLVNLTTLVLNKFEQDIIPKENVFQSFKELDRLEFRKIPLTSIHAQAFENKLFKLRKLKFVDVSLSEIPVQSLTHLSNLEVLFIKSTQIYTIFSRSFERLANLEELDLSNNKITTLQHEAFFTVANYLKILDLSVNYNLELSSLPALSSQKWPQLHTLSLAYNSLLANMPKNVFKNMPTLEYLNLAEIGLTQIQADMFQGLNNLHTLDLSFNKIATIEDGAFNGLSSLSELRLNYQFYIYPGLPIPLYTAMEMKPSNFYGISKSVQTLNLQNTPLKSSQFWNTIKIFTNLLDINLGQTRLTTIPAFGFQHNTKLQRLSLFDNNITQLSPYAFKGLESRLSEIDLLDNKLETISECVFKDFIANKLIKISLSANPLNCDCRIKWLLKFIDVKYKANPNFYREQYVCKTPHVDKFLYEIPENNLTCTAGVHVEDCQSLPLPTPAITTTVQPTTAKATTPVNPSPVTVTLTIASSNQNSITVAWKVSDIARVIEFKLEYSATINGHETILLLHRDAYLHSIYNLSPGLFYKICITAVLHNSQQTKQTCRTEQTGTSGGDSGGQSGSETGSQKDENNGNNVTIGIVLGSVAFVVLVVIGLYMVVKYKMQKLNMIQWTMTQGAHSRQDLIGGDDDEYGHGRKKGKVTNEYTEINAVKLAELYNANTSSTKQMQRQFAINSQTDEENDSFGNNGKNTQYAYSTYRKAKKRRSPYENDSSEEEDKPEEDQVQLKREIVTRHSAPSRLDAKELMKQDKERDSRPLPATPIHLELKNDQSRDKPSASSEKSKKSGKIITQVSVYGNEAVEDKDHDSVYYEIQTNTLPRK